MAIVDKIAKVLEYSIKVDSVQGKGSMFSIQVPIGEIASLPSNTTFPIQVLPNTILAQRIIWVIDNDANICDGMERLLGGWDCTVITAISLEHLEEQVDIYQDHVDILIVDYHLDDDKTGFSAAKIINKGRASSIPTLMITANYSKSLKTEVEKTGILLLNKPVKPMKLKTSMLHLLR